MKASFQENRIRSCTVADRKQRRKWKQCACWLASLDGYELFQRLLGLLAVPFFLWPLLQPPSRPRPPLLGQQAARLCGHSITRRTFVRSLASIFCVSSFSLSFWSSSDLHIHDHSFVDFGPIRRHCSSAAFSASQVCVPLNHPFFFWRSHSQRSDRIILKRIIECERKEETEGR